MDRNRVILAEILRERGNRGEVLGISTTDVPGRLEALRSAQVRLSDGSDQAVDLEEAWPYKDGWVFKFAGVDSIEAAEKLRNSELWVSPEHRGRLGDREWFQSDLVGCQVIDQSTGQSVGTITGWQEFGGPPLMAVDHGGKEVLIPFVAEYCRQVDLAQRRLVADYPAGLLAELVDLA